MTCQHCNRQHPLYYTYCPETSKTIDHSLVQKYQYNTMEFCHACGTKNEKGHSACSACGATQLMIEQKKNLINKLLDNKIPKMQNIQIPSAKRINTEDIKVASKESIDYIKGNKLILLPILISFVIVLLSSFILKFALVDFGKEMVDEGEEAAIVLGVIDTSILEYAIEEEFDMNVNLPNWASIPSYISAFHNVDLSFSASIGEDGYEEKMKGSIDNIFYGLLLIPFLALVVGGIVYGILARRHHWPFFKGFVYSVIAYTGVMTVISLFARLSIKEKFEFFGEYSFIIKASSSFIDMLISSFLLATIVFGCTSLIAYYGKNALEKLSEQAKYLQYAIFATAVTVAGLVLNILHSFIGISSETEDLNSIGKAFVSLYTGTGNWMLSQFGKLSIVQFGESDSLRWYSGEDYTVLNEFFRNEEIVVLPTFLLTLLAIALIGGAGYILYSIHKLEMVDVAIFASMFTVLQLVLVYFTSINIEFDQSFFGDSFEVSLSILNTIICSFLLAFASFFGGGLLRKQLNK
ncbi:zinc ribbon domain-containing protein [Lysinibacillus sp. 54212]|uniref:zinc ribbon domain-containing protein n=1 Tax=Lysinibacillus sp. 54212 TaxID=3119829 RepID=UPI002FCCB6D9